MANVGLTVSIKHAIPFGQFSLADGAIGDPNTTAPSTTAVVADVATAVTDGAAAVAAEVSVTAVDNAVSTLVADGASPTQAHVTTLNTAWGTLKTNITTLKTAVDLVNTDIGTLNTDWGTLLTALTAYAAQVGKLTADATFFYNPTNVSTMNHIRAVLRRVEHLMAGRIGE